MDTAAFDFVYPVPHQVVLTFVSNTPTLHDPSEFMTLARKEIRHLILEYPVEDTQQMLSNWIRDALQHQRNFPEALSHTNRLN